jgi:hypothetical protein
MVDTTEHLDKTITAQTQMQNKAKAETPQLKGGRVGLWCLTPFSIIFQVY